MKIIRFVETSEGGSCFEEIDIPFPQPYVDEFGNTYHLTRPFSSSAVIADLPQGLNQDWHVAPSRQIVIVLTGRLEVEVTDGEVRRWGPGDMFMADDSAGKGHRTRIIEGPAKLFFLRLADDFRPEEWMLDHPAQALG
jgi:quercetin dioxygenase-like cupin family protein